MPVFHQFQHILALSKIKLFKSPVVEQKDVRAGELCNDLGEAPVVMRYRERLKQA